MRCDEAFFELLRAFPPTAGGVELRAAAAAQEQATRAFFRPSDPSAMTGWLAGRGQYPHASFGIADVPAGAWTER